MKTNSLRHAILLAVTVTQIGFAASSFAASEPPQSDALAGLVTSAASAESANFFIWAATLEEAHPGVLSIVLAAQAVRPWMKIKLSG